MGRRKLYFFGQLSHRRKGENLILADWNEKYRHWEDGVIKDVMAAESNM